MTTSMMEMQSVGGLYYHDTDLNDQMASGMSSLYGPNDGWGSSPLEAKPSNTDNYLGFSVPNLHAPDGRFRLNTNFQHDRPYTKRPLDITTGSQRSCSNVIPSAAPNADMTPLRIPPQNIYSVPSMFTPTNAPESSQGATTISPLATRFDQDELSPASTGSLSFDGRHYSPESAKAMHFPTKQQQAPSKRRRDSLQTTLEDQSPIATQSSAGRRRRSEYAEPGSARAIYLEKNRKAASKCRSKQKMQQEELVETARDVERKNRVLKAEVDMLRSGMRELMEIVGQHSECPDSRLRTYVQREADRLASGGSQALVHPASSRSSLSTTNTSPPTSYSSDRS